MTATKQTPVDQVSQESEDAAVGAVRTDCRSRIPFIELSFLVMFYCAAASGNVVFNLVMERTCVHTLGNTLEECRLLQEPGVKPPELQDLEREVQGHTTTITMVKSVLDSIFPALLALFLGGWSNKHGRKPLLVAPACGYAISMLLMWTFSALPSLGPWWFVGTALPFSLSGGTSAFSVGAVCLINDVSTQGNGTLRVALLQSAALIGVLVAMLTTSFVVDAIGTVNTLCVLFVFSVFCEILAICARETVPNPIKGGLCSVFDLSLPKEMFRAILVRRPSYGRLVLMIVVIANTLDLLVMQGTGQIDYFFVRQRLSWNLTEQNIFSAFNTLVMVVGMVLGVLILQKLFGLSDPAAIVISYLSSSAEAIIRIFVTATWMVYLGSVVALFRGLSFPLVRTVIAKRVEGPDVARLLAIMSCVETVLSILSPLLFNTIYSMSLETFSGAVYAMNASFYLFCVALMGVVWFVSRRYPLQKDPQSEQLSEAF